MFQAVVRLFAQLGLVLAGLTAIVMQSNDSAAAIIFIYPVVLGIPGALISLLVLAPLEYWFDRRGLGATTYVVSPIVCALLPWLLFPLAGNTDNFLNGVWMLMPVGAAWGLLWAVTRPIGRWLFGGERRPG